MSAQAFTQASLGAHLSIPGPVEPSGLLQGLVPGAPSRALSISEVLRTGIQPSTVLGPRDALLVEGPIKALLITNVLSAFPTTLHYG